MAEQVLFDALGDAGVEPPGTRSNPDVIITADRLSNVLNSIRATLQRMVTTTAHHELPNAYDATSIEVLGKRVPIRVRNTDHYDLMRVNDLYQGLERGVASAGYVDVFALPHLGNLDHAILVAAKGAVPRAALPAVLQRRLTHLEMMTRNSENVSELRRLAVLATDDDVVEEHLKRLQRWNLVRQTRDGTVQGTRKLKTVRI